jgi:hypothetical protein
MESAKDRDFSRFEKRKIHQSEQPSDGAEGEKAGTPATKALGRWTRHGFEFASPEAEDQWHREAYRQAVHHEGWHMGDPVDHETLQLIDAGLAGKTPPTFHGPDGQARFANAHTIEPIEIRTIRARNFAGKTVEQVSAPKMPGEDEALHYMGGRGRSRAAARSPLNERSQEIAGVPQPSNQPSPVLVADLSALPSMPEGFGNAAPAAPRPIGGFEPLNAGGKIPSGNAPDVMPRPANDNIKPSLRPNSSSVLKPQSINPTTPPNSIATPTMPGESPAQNLKSDVDNAVQASMIDLHKRWAQDILSNPKSQDPAYIADRANQLIIFDLPHVIDNFRYQPGRDILQSATPLDIELLRGAYTQKVVDLFPSESRPAIQKELDARPKILTSGPAGLSDILQAMQQGEVTGFEINGAPIAPETTMYNPHGTLGSPEIQDFNKIVKEEAGNLLEACKDPGTEIEHIAGAGKTEFHIQDFLKPWMQEGSRRIDVTLKFKINGQDCSFQINTADRAIRRLFAGREWDAIKASAKMMRENGANSEAIKEYLDGKLAGKLVSQLNAFFMVPKPGKDKRTDEDMRNLARETLGVLSCSEIELACRGNLVINKDPADSVQ